MDEVLKFFTENPTFYLATTEGDEPKVRPFGFIMNYEGKLYFCTGNRKKVYRQLKANPNCEMCSTATANGEWVRLKGKAVFDDNLAAKKKVLEIAPVLSNIYKGAEDPTFEVFYLTDCEATFCSMSPKPYRTVKL
ncbi:MAG: pyridoxamine 5'-phosphate oxidase family protein [Desulfitobacteriaceae bacterium]|nr:pyridoxamine 5'-phosphate oxidase family protein [Desulfitobacteriaceae bacterium]MDD4752742.1 pyridoxamine 5'-phosphate oxidase family protein [Desulfitobacteriaceae bacterium]